MSYTKHYTYNILNDYLLKKHTHSKFQISTVKKHIDSCKECWLIWNKVRWDKAALNKGTQELKKYLGNDFIMYHDSSWALANEWYSKSPINEKEVADFYKNTSNYVYNSLIFFESGDRKDFSSYFETLQQKYHIKSVIDYGCGIGNDGLTMLKQKLDVYFADFISPSTNFLKWRLEQRKLSSKKRVFDVEKNEFPQVDMVWTIDALEHMTNPDDIFRTISSQTKLFVYFIDEDDQAGGRHPFHIPFDHTEFQKKLIDLGFSEQKHNYLSIWLRNN